MLSVSVVALIWLVSLRTLSTALDPTLEGTWKDWKATHGKEYTQEEEESFRRAVWEENLRMIQDHNKQADLGKYTYWLGINHFGDLTNEELGKRLHCLLSHNVSKVKGIPFKSSENVDIPDHVDWRIKGGVTKVKDQGECGACWAFSATGALEGMHFRKTGKLVSLSEQNLIDCSGDPEFKGCRGSLMENAFETVRKRGGINSEKIYPYDRQDGMSCRYKPEESITRCSSFGRIINDEKGLQEAVAKIGPVSVGIDARSNKFGFYKTGIYREDYHGERQINHAMLIVGYNNTSRGKGYWIVKNSWSTFWGEKGYMRVDKGSNQCAIAEDAAFPIPDPEKGI